MPTARISLILAESDETTRREIRDIQVAEAYEEKYDGGITLAANAEDVLITPPQISASKILVLTAEDLITVKLNDNSSTPMTGVTLLVLAASDVESLYLTNPGDTDTKVRINMYGDA
jgi:hypothetical protein